MKKHFEPSSTLLNSMIAAAMAKCDASREQAALKKEAAEDERAARAWAAQAAAQSRARRWGHAA